MEQLGMSFYGCQTPNGYSWTSNAWVNTGDLLDRINIALNLANNKLGIATNMDGLIADLSRQPFSAALQSDAQQKESWLADALLNGPASAQTQNAILKQIEGTGGAVAGMKPASANAKVLSADATKHFRAYLPDSFIPVPGPSDPEASTIAGLLLGSPDFQRR
jgi:hypothetical protein